MASVTLSQPLDMATRPTLTGQISEISSSRIVIQAPGKTAIFGGSFSSVGGHPAGVATSYLEYAGATLSLRIDGLNLDASMISTSVTGAQFSAFFALNDVITGSGGNDVILAGSGRDYIRGSAGDDTIDGGDGVDTAIYLGFKADFTVGRESGSLVVRDNLPAVHDEGTDRLIGVERVSFFDATLAFDEPSYAIYRLYAAAFHRTPDPEGLGYWIARQDSGTSLKAIAENLIASNEFIATYGARTDNAAFVNLVYQNVLNRPADAAGSRYWAAQLDGGLSRAELMTGFSESAEGKAITAPLLANGLSYVEAVFIA